MEAGNTHAPSSSTTADDPTPSARPPWVRMLLTSVLVVSLPSLIGYIAVSRLGYPAGCGEPDVLHGTGQRVRLSGPTVPTTMRANTPSLAPVRFIVAPVISPESSLGRYDALAAYLGRALGRPVRLQQQSSYAKVSALLRHGEADVAFVCTFPYVEGEKDFGLQALVVPRIHGQVVYYSYIIARREVPGDTLLALRGRRFASADVRSNTGWIFPKFWLTQRGVNVSRFFSRHLLAGSHDRALKAVLDGDADAAAVDSLVYDEMAGGDPAVRQKTRILMKSQAFGMPPVVVPPGIDPDLKRAMQRALLDAHRDPRGRRALKQLGFDRFELPTRAHYDTVRQMARMLRVRR